MVGAKVTALAVVITVAGLGGLYTGYETLRTDGTRQESPHIVFVIADDLGFNDIGYNNHEVLTPNLDTLAGEGLILENNYVQPVCTPSRAAFLTGKYPFTIGMQHGLLAAGVANCAPTNVRFLPEILRERGYQTHMAGKWHLGHCKWECTPTYRGFDTFTGFYQGQEDYYSHVVQGAYDWRNDTKVDLDASGVYSTELIKERALSILEGYREGDKPLFLYLAFPAPHTPLQAPKEFLDIYPDVTEPRKTYLAMISAVDEAVGEVVNGLKEKGIWKNTLFIFTSDNGGSVTPESSNLPLRGAKSTLFEGGTRVPGFVSGPLVTEKQRTTESLFHISDWAPTILKMADIDIDEDFDGVDQSLLFREGKESVRTEVIYNIDKDWTGDYFYGNIAIRSGDWKLIWGLPGAVDGWGTNTTPIQRSNYYLNFINKTLEDYTEPLPQTSLSSQETEFLYAIAKTMGVYNITYEEMEKGKGHVMLFNLKDDPGEKEDMSENTAHEDLIFTMKKRIMGLIRDKYVPTSENAQIDRTEAATVNGIWGVGWCKDLNTDIPAITQLVNLLKAMFK